MWKSGICAGKDTWINRSTIRFGWCKADVHRTLCPRQGARGLLMDGTAVERELTDRNKGISNEVREKRYQEYVRGWVEYFRLADMKELLRKTDEWARRRIRAVYWKQWKKIKTKYRMLKALGLEDWKAKELANSRKGYWKMAKVLNQIFSKKIIAKLGYTSMLDYYLIICEN